MTHYKSTYTHTRVTFTHYLLVDATLGPTSTKTLPVTLAVLFAVTRELFRAYTLAAPWLISVTSLGSCKYHSLPKIPYPPIREYP
jgi:hypothetical protein